MVNQESGQSSEQRINAVAERILALDIDLRELSWARVREIAAALASGRHSPAECQAFAQELDSIALTNLTLVSNLREASASSVLDEAVPTAEDDAGFTYDVSLDVPADEESGDCGVRDDGRGARSAWDDDTAPVNVVQMLNAEMVYQSEDEHDKDRYAAAAAQASLYDDPVAVILPSAEELERVEDCELREEVAAEQAERDRAKMNDTDRTPVAEKRAPGVPGVGGSKPADPKPAEGEPSISVDFSGRSRAERAILAEKERKEERKRKKQEERRHFLSGLFGRKEETEAEAVVIPRGKVTEAPGDLFRDAERRGDDAASAGNGKAAATGAADDAEGDRATASADPSTFELFHTSNDGKVSFFRDADGHITAVNTNRLV